LTTLRATGATANTTGNAISQDGSQAPIQSLANPSINPAVRKVAMPETSRDIMQDSTNPNKTGAKRADIIGHSPFLN
jgi:hypothetical protein